MIHNLNEQLKEYGRKHRLNRRWIKVLSAMACVVVFCTVYALILPAVTLDHQTICGKEEHTHSAEVCYTKELICSDTSESHIHSEACYASVLTCELEEHQHSQTCYSQDSDRSSAESAMDSRTESELGKASDQAAGAVQTASDMSGASDHTSDNSASTNQVTEADAPQGDDGTITPYENAADTYQATIVYYDANQSGVTGTQTTNLKSGLITDNLPSVGDEYTYVGAYLTTADDYTGHEIAYVTVIGDTVYYAVEADARAASPLKDRETIALHYVPTSSIVNVKLTEEGETGVSGNEVTGVPTVCKRGSSFDFQVSAARGYTATVKVGDTVTTVESGQTETITANADTTDLDITVTYAKKTAVTFDPNVFQDTTYRYLYDSGTARFTATNNRDQTATLNPATGASFTYTFTTASTSTTWQVDSMKINGVYLEVPVRTPGTSATTTIVSSQNGEPAMTATLTVTGESYNWRTQQTSYTYQLTINGAYEDVVIDAANLNNVTWAEVIPSATEGVTFQNNNDTSGLNEPVQTEENHKPSFTFGLEDGYEDLKMKLYAYDSSGTQITLSSGLSGDTITLPTRVGTSTNVTYRYRSGWGSQTYTYTDAVITKNADGTYTIEFSSTNSNTGITLQLLKVSATKKEYKVLYDVNGGTGSIIDDAVYDIIDNHTVVVTSRQPTPPEGKYFHGWTIEGDDSGKLYFAGTSIDLKDDEIQSILNSQADTKTLKLVANYVTQLDNDSVIDVPVQIYLNDVENPDLGYSVQGVVGKDLALMNVSQTIVVDGVTYDLVKSDSPLAAVNVGDAFHLRYESRASLTVLKYEKGSQDKTLQGAVFTLTKSDDTSITSKSTGTDGKVTITDIPGGTYTLTETTAPTNYKTMSGGVTVTVKNGTLTVDTGSTGAEWKDNILYVPDELDTVDAVIAKQDNTGQALAGAEFYLYYEDENHTKYYYKNGSWTTDSNEKSVIAPAGDVATTAVSGLTIGTTYYLVETKAPDGYQLLTDEISITPTSSTELKVSENKGASADGLTVTVVNQTGEALPNTGGMGTKMYTFSGLALAAAAVLGSVMYSGKRRKSAVK